MPELAAVMAASSLGAMVFFSGVVAATVFQVLQEALAGQFLRALFPKYFLANGIVAILAGLVAWRLVETILFLASGALLLALHFVGVPIINRARDAMLSGDVVARGQFERWHRGTVILNVGEMLLLSLGIYWRGTRDAASKERGRAEPRYSARYRHVLRRGMSSILRRGCGHHDRRRGEQNNWGPGTIPAFRPLGRL